MILQALNNNRFSRLLAVIFLITIPTLFFLFIENHNKTVELEKELSRVNKELYVKQIAHQKRVEEFEKEAKKRQRQLEQSKSELLSKLKNMK